MSRFDFITDQFYINWILILMDTTIKGSIMISVALLFVKFFKNIASASKYALFFASVLCFVLFPILSVYWNHAEPTAIHINTGDTFLMQQSGEDLGFVPSTSHEGIIPAHEGFHHALNSRLLSTTLFTLWLLGFLFMLSRYFIGFFGATFIKLMSKSYEDNRIDSIVQKIRSDIKLSRFVKVYIGRRIYMPFTFGLIKPVIILPDESHIWSDQRLMIVLTHELMHVKRLDSLTQFISSFICAVYWFNPLIWFTYTKLNEEKESACDDCVLGAGAEPYLYAKELLEIVKTCCLPRYLTNTVSKIARESSTERRIIHILDKDKNRKKISHKRLTGYLFVLLTITISLSLMNTVSAQKTVSFYDLTVNNQIFYYLEETINHQSPSQHTMPDLLPFELKNNLSSVHCYDKGILFQLNGECTPIIASASGKVSQVFHQNASEIKMIIDHENGFRTLYSPCFELQVKPGDYVEKGEVIAYTNGVHETFFEISFYSVPINPESYLSLNR